MREMLTEKCPHLNCLTYHPDGNCTCDMKPYCPECRESNQDQKDMVENSAVLKCEHHMGWRVQGGYSYYCCMKHNCNYIDGKKTFSTLISTTRREVIEEIKEEFEKSEMTPNISGHIGIDQAKQWIYEVLDKLK